MWVMSCESKELVKASFFKIQKNIGSKDKKWALVAYSQTVNNSILTGVICDYYSEEDRAIMALEKLIAFMEENHGKVYRFDKF